MAPSSTPAKHPKPLREGDSVSLLSPSGPLHVPGDADWSQELLESWGYKVSQSKTTKTRHKFFSGKDADRAADLNESLGKSKAIFCTRGGNGLARLLPLTDFSKLAENPVLLTGFSDLSSLHAAFLTQANLVSLHSPVMVMGFKSESGKVTPECAALFRRFLTSTEPVGSYNEALNWGGTTCMTKGKATGQIIGGNLAVFLAMLGTKYMPNPAGKILFLEDINEEPYRLDRMIVQFKQNGYIDQLAGIVLGQFTDCESDDSRNGTAQDVLAEQFGDLNIPVINNFPTGHCSLNASLPFGCQVEVDADNGDLIALEAFCQE